MKVTTIPQQMNGATVTSNRILLYVPARGGSKGLPGKNLLKVGGASLVARALIAARRWRREAGVPLARIFLDTDDPSIADEGTRWGAWVPFLRPADLAQDHVATSDAVLAALDRLEATGTEVDTIVLLQPTSPLRAAEDIAACMAPYDQVARPSVITVVPAEHPPGLALRMHDDARLTWMTRPEGGIVRRQAFGSAWYASGAVYITSTDLLRRERAFVIDGVSWGVARPRAASLDVDTAEDLELANRMAWVSGPWDQASLSVLEVAEPAAYRTIDLPIALDLLDREGGASDTGLLLKADSVRGTSDLSPQVAIRLWRWATGTSIGWLHDDTDLAGTVAAVAGGAAFIGTVNMSEAGRQRLARLLTDLLARIGER